MRKAYTENQHDILFAHLSVWLRLRGIQPKHIFSLTRPIFLRSPSSQWRDGSNSASLETPPQGLSRCRPQWTTTGGQTAALVPTTPFWEDLTCSPSGRGMGFLECTSSDLVPAQALHRGSRLPVSPALSRKEKPCCSLALHRAGKALVKSAEARKPEKEFLRVLKG